MPKMLQLKMLYYRWRCRKCRQGEHDWETLSERRSDDLWLATGGRYTKSCKRPSCTVMR